MCGNDFLVEADSSAHETITNLPAKDTILKPPTYDGQIWKPRKLDYKKPDPTLKFY